MGKYEEALERAKQGLPIDEVFPELKESKDERIRKELLAVIDDLVLPDEQKARFNTYLERQKEQKSVEWNDADMNEARKDLISLCMDWERGKKTTLLPVCAVRARYFLEHFIKPQNLAEWSEEDEKIWKDIFELCNRFGYDDACRLLKSSLRPQPHWKPSEEQMDCLVVAASGYGNSEVSDVLSSLINDLQKLL